MLGRMTGFRGRCALGLFAGLLAATVFAGCSKHAGPPIKGTKLAVFPVKGKLMMDGKPMGSATVMFNPVRKFPKEAAQMRPHATVDENGDFTVSTYANGDGAPAGEYKITVSWRGGEDAAGLPDGARAELEDKAPESFQAARTSRIRVKINEGENKLEPWDLGQLESHASNTP
jgi:hypothetical protein